MQNRTTEDYIKNIYKLQRKGEKVLTSALAAALELSDPSITDMVKKLSDKGLVRYEPYQGVELTAGGRRMALRILRRHRLWEMFLVKFLNYSWDRVHDEAEQLEHVTSDELERKLDKVLGFPAADPHGDPIPNADGVLVSTAEIALTECDAGDSVEVLRVSDEDSEILQHAAELGVGLNTKLKVKEKRIFDGSMLVKVGNKQQYISRRVAESIFVQAV